MSTPPDTSGSSGGARSQAERSEATRARLLATARELFAERGYAAVGTEEIVRRSGLTRGALYHQFGGKRDLFKAVFEQIEGELVERIPVEELLGGDALGALRAGVETVLDLSLEAEVQRIALVDAPSVLGFEEWREIEERHGLGLLEAGLATAMEAGQIERRPVDPLAHLMLGALIVAAQYVARSEDVARAREEMGDALRRVIEGLRPP